MPAVVLLAPLSAEGADALILVLQPAQQPLRGQDHPMTTQIDPRIEPQIDPRGARFAAAVTATVLAAVLLAAPSTTATGLLALQAVVFAVGAGLGVQRTPYAVLFRSLVRPRLAPPAELEDAAPPRFAQAVGLGFAGVGLVALLAGATTLGLLAVGLALAAAFLNAAFGFCLGCELYLLLKRTTVRTAHSIATN